MPCGCNGGAAKAPEAQYEVRLPDGTKKVVANEHEAKVAVTLAGGGSFSRI